MKFKIQGTKTSVELDSSHFLAKGGEGSIYAKNGVVYKICEPGKMIPEGKFNELAVMTNPNIIKPEQMLLDNKGVQVGYTMRFVPDTFVLCSMFTKSFRLRENVSVDQVLDLVRKLQTIVSDVHKSKILCVDLNENNFLVSKKFDDVYAIDVNSYQTKSYPATAIMDSIRDRHCHNVFTETTDWFSFAVVAFQMFIGIHPFKGRHPSYPDMDARMKANISVLNTQVTYPKAACMPLDVIPPVYLKWFEAVFDRGERVAPPKDLTAVVELVQAVIKQVTGNNNLIINQMIQTTGPILGYFTAMGKEIIFTDKDIKFAQYELLPSPKTKLTFTPSGDPVIGWLEGDSLRLKNLTTGNMVPLVANGEMLFSSNNRIYLRHKTQVSEIVFTEIAGQTLTSVYPVANIMELASQVYDGVVIQDLFDAHYASIFPNTKVHRQIALRELDGYKVRDAKYEGRVLMIVAVNQKGQYDRFIYRFDDEFKHDLRIVPDIVPMGLNFTVLDNGICVCLTEDEKLEIFRCTKGSVGVKVVEDPTIEADMRLTHKGAQTLFIRDNRIYSLSLR
jgi:hypothetical protein